MVCPAHSQAGRLNEHGVVMQHRTVIWLLAVLLATAGLSITIPAHAKNASESPNSTPLAAGTLFPDVTIAGDMSGKQADYLGVDSMPGKFALHGLKAQVIILQIYSMYCPFCQEEAPTMKTLYRHIQERGLADKIKLFGVAAGNSQLEVDIFRDKYGIEFPLFPDPEFTIHQACGQVGTPFFYILEKDSRAGGFVVRHTVLGRMESPEALLRDVLKHTKL